MTLTIAPAGTVMASFFPSLSATAIVSVRSPHSSRFRFTSSTTRRGRTTSPTISACSAECGTQIVFIGVAQEKAEVCNGKKVNGRFEFNRDKAVYINHCYFLNR